MTDCLFCKIASGEIPSEKVYEDDYVFAFLDIRPINEGHTLIVPKKHYLNIFDTPDEVLEYMIVVAKKVAQALQRSIQADGINIGMNNGEVAGQVIWHAHMHVMPRESGDGHRHWIKKETTSEERQKTAKLITEALESGDPQPQPVSY
jgi:histidine triad (HIT) family protein